VLLEAKTVKEISCPSSLNAFLAAVPVPSKKIFIAKKGSQDLIGTMGEPSPAFFFSCNARATWNKKKRKENWSS
jgi:hypothetical protein